MFVALRIEDNFYPANMGIVNGEEASQGEKDPPPEPQANGDHSDSRETSPEDVTDNGMVYFYTFVIRFC